MQTDASRSVAAGTPSSPANAIAAIAASGPAAASTMKVRRTIGVGSAAPSPRDAHFIDMPAANMRAASTSAAAYPSAWVSAVPVSMYER